jgi:hypothetical protein
MARGEAAPRIGEGGSRQLRKWVKTTGTKLCSLRANKWQLRGSRLVRRILQVGGPRLVLEILEELIQHGLSDEADLDGHLGRYIALDRDVIVPLSADEFSHAPMRIIVGARQ